MRPVGAKEELMRRIFALVMTVVLAQALVIPAMAGSQTRYKINSTTNKSGQINSKSTSAASNQNIKVKSISGRQPANIGWKGYDSDAAKKKKMKELANQDPIKAKEDKTEKGKKEVKAAEDAVEKEKAAKLAAQKALCEKYAKLHISHYCHK
jgi:acid phosphatase class B